jgi:two-component system, cell cycle sensor histidine kinase and response regulator CckA
MTMNLPLEKRNTSSVAMNPADSVFNEHFAAGDQEPSTVLIVDDESAILEVRRTLLEGLGYAAITSQTGEKALEILRKKSVNAVILDYAMPGMDGEETALGIRKLHRNIPIILSSASLTIPQRMLKLVTDFVPKGSGPTHLIEVLEEQIQRAKKQKARTV